MGEKLLKMAYITSCLGIVELRRGHGSVAQEDCGRAKQVAEDTRDKVLIPAQCPVIRSGSSSITNISTLGVIRLAISYLVAIRLNNFALMYGESYVYILV